MTLCKQRMKLLDLVLALVPVRALPEYHSLQLEAQRIVRNVCRRRAELDNVGDGDILPDNSSSGCKISLMAHFRLHLRYRVLRNRREETAFEK